MSYNLSKTSFIIHFRKDSEDRLFNLRTILRFLNGLNSKEIIVINDDKEVDPCIRELRVEYPKVEWGFMRNEDEFKKSSAFNRAAEMATGDVLCFYDVDILIDPVYLEESQNLLMSGKTDHSYPFNGLFVDLQKEAFEDILPIFDFPEMLLALPERHIGFSNHSVIVASDSSPGGVNMITREAFQRMNGFDENFIGWGFEDTDFMNRSKRVNRVSRIEHPDAICWHLHHDNAIRTENKHYQSNLQQYVINANRI